MNIIELKHINKSFGTKDTKINVLKDINLCIKEGEMIAITGPSGSGKSTLLNILGCLDTIDSGTYIINTEKISNFSKNKLAHLRNSTFGFVVQFFALIDDYTVFENVKLPLSYSNIKQKNSKNLILNLLDELGIKDKQNKYPSQLSGGQNQRVAIARALINNPDIILADEPTGALDSTIGNEVLELLTKLNKKGKTVIIVTHDNNIANKCDRTICLKDGSIIN